MLVLLQIVALVVTREHSDNLKTVQSFAQSADCLTSQIRCTSHLHLSLHIHQCTKILYNDINTDIMILMF